MAQGRARELLNEVMREATRAAGQARDDRQAGLKAQRPRARPRRACACKWLHHLKSMRIAPGTGVHGRRSSAATQPGGGTVQDALEAALAVIAGERVDVTCAGRTDRGVHALEQVVHFDVATPRPESAWIRGVNALLPESVAVQWSREVPAEFHARYAARARTYRYVLVNRAVRPALAARHAGWFHLPLDVAAMRAAARHLRGEHDFSAFRSAECQAKTPVRTLRAG